MAQVSALRSFCGPRAIAPLRRIRNHEGISSNLQSGFRRNNSRYCYRREHAFWSTLPFRALRSQRTLNVRTFSIESVPSILIPPTVFVGLLLALWTWKCMMMVIFQDKIIYMPSMPPFARSEKMSDYAEMCKPVLWEEKQIKSLDGTKIALCIGQFESASHVRKTTKEVIICYFQGNGSSLPPRLPILSSVLKSVEAKALADGTPIRYTLIGLSYRGYWTSAGRASQAGIELDAQALLDFVSSNTAANGIPKKIILWGQSIGSGVATNVAAKFISQFHKSSDNLSIDAIVLETPFTSVKSMLIALYPQKWLPYRYLWPLLWNRWDSEAALREIALWPEKIPKILILPATRDEVVPSEEADKLERLCEDLNIPFERKNVEGALHNEATIRRDGQEAIAKFIASMTQ